MKRGTLLLIFAVIFVTARASPINPYGRYAQDMEWREGIGNICLKQLQLDRRVVQRVVATLEFPTENQKYKDFLSCSYKRQGFQSEDGNMLYDNINLFLSRDHSTADLKALDTCKSTTGANDGERAFNAVVCIINKLKTIPEKNENDI